MTNDIKKIIWKEFETFPEVEIVILFGSAVKGRLVSNSDIDIAFATKTCTLYEKKHEIYLALEKSLKRDIDLIDLHQVNGHILKNVLCNGEIIKKKINPSPGLFFKENVVQSGRYDAKNPNDIGKTGKKIYRWTGRPY